MHRGCTEYLTRKRTLVRIYAPTEDHIRSRRHCPPPGALRHRQGRPPIAADWLHSGRRRRRGQTDGAVPVAGRGYRGNRCHGAGGPPAELWPAGRETRPASCPLIGKPCPRSTDWRGPPCHPDWAQPAPPASPAGAAGRDGSLVPWFPGGNCAAPACLKATHLLRPWHALVTAGSPLRALPGPLGSVRRRAPARVRCFPLTGPGHRSCPSAGWMVNRQPGRAPGMGLVTPSLPRWARSRPPPCLRGPGS